MKAGGTSTPPVESAPFNPPTGPRGASNVQKPQPSFNGLREQADRERRERKAEPQIHDGSYGFDDRRAQPAQRSRRDDIFPGNGRSDNRSGDSRSYGGRGGGSQRNDDRGGLYSDEMMIDEPSAAPRGRRRGQR